MTYIFIILLLIFLFFLILFLILLNKESPFAPWFFVYSVVIGIMLCLVPIQETTEQYQIIDKLNDKQRSGAIVNTNKDNVVEVKYLENSKLEVINRDIQDCDIYYDTENAYVILKQGVNIFGCHTILNIELHLGSLEK